MFYGKIFLKLISANDLTVETDFENHADVAADKLKPYIAIFVDDTEKFKNAGYKNDPKVKYISKKIISVIP